MELKDGFATFYAPDQQVWRDWLMENHATQKQVWLIIYKKQTSIPSVYYNEAVDEAICFGWIDSKINKRDDQSFYQFFSQRNPKSNWSQVNKLKVERLAAEGKIMPAGWKMIELAKEKGTWTALDAVEDNVMPPDMQILFDQNPMAFHYFEQFPRSIKRGILEWILNAKRPETRQKRIEATVLLAEKNIRANQYNPKK